MTAASSTVDAINATDVTKIGIGVIIGLVVIGAILGLLVTAVIGRVLIAVVVIGLAVFVWLQRGTVEDKLSQQACPPKLSFFGLHLDAPQSYRHYCAVHNPRRHHGPGNSPIRSKHGN